ncbi:hypothetical protein ABIB00_003073 [Bradyrhizobium sp. LB14.3]|uniref:hypothetical protein n=1 Tax=Bradyrhizobium sp. LB14.3 TaxID=3156328 RepID=UPI003390DCFD
MSDKQDPTGLPADDVAEIDSLLDYLGRAPDHLLRDPSARATRVLKERYGIERVLDQR